jgi:GT2 family glycosyltransferase
VDLSIIIINYNTADLTQCCIRSVVEHTEGLNYEIILVDNASTELLDVDSIRREFPGLKLVMSPENLGFAGGNNLGIRSATGEYILLLNSDTYLNNNALFRMYEFMKARPNAGAASARLIFPDGQYQCVAQRFPSLSYSIVEFLRLQKFMGRRAAGKLLLGGFFDHNETVRADWVWGTCFMFPRKVLAELPGGQLDDRYFMYSEDIQWCMDIRRLGYEIYFVAEAEVVHIMGGSSETRDELMEKNGADFLERNYKPVQIRWIKKLEEWLSR